MHHVLLWCWWGVALATPQGSEVQIPTSSSASLVAEVPAGAPLAAAASAVRRVPRAPVWPPRRRRPARRPGKLIAGAEQAADEVALEIPSGGVGGRGDAALTASPASALARRPLIRSEGGRPHEEGGLRDPFAAALPVEASALLRQDSAVSTVRLLVIGEVTGTTACVLLELQPGFISPDVVSAPLSLAPVVGTGLGAAKPPSSIKVRKMDALAATAGGIQARLSSGLPVVFRFEGLVPQTKYVVQLNQGLLAPLLPNGSSFRTLPNGTQVLKAFPEGLRVGFASCNKYSLTKLQIPQNEDLWEALKKQLPNLDIMFHIGDNVYLDDDYRQWKSGQTGGGKSTSADMLIWCYWCQAEMLLSGRTTLEQWEEMRDKVEDLFRTAYRTTWSHPPTAHVLANMVNLFIMDDHEVRDNWSTREEDWVPGSRTRWLGKLAFDIAWEYEYSLMESAPLEPFSGSYGAAVYGDVGILVLDERFARTWAPNRATGDTDQLLGDPQWDFIRRALAPNGTMKDVKALLVPTGTPLAVLGNAMTKMASSIVEDAAGMWDSFPKEQVAISRLLYDWKTSGPNREVSVIGGDVHFGGLYRFYMNGKKAFDQMVTSAISNSIVNVDMMQMGMKILGSELQLTGNASIRIQKLVSKMNYGRLVVKDVPGDRPVIRQELWVTDGQSGSMLDSSLETDGDLQDNAAGVFWKMAGQWLGVIISVSVLIMVYFRKKGHRTHHAWGLIGAAVLIAVIFSLMMLRATLMLHPSSDCAPPWRKYEDGATDADAVCPYGKALYTFVTVPQDPTVGDYVAVGYGLLPIALTSWLLGRIVVQAVLTRTVGTREIFFFSFPLICCPLAEFILKSLIRQPRPDMSCLTSCGMPSGHSVVSVGVYVILLLDAGYRVWPKEIPLKPHLTSNWSIIYDFPFLSGEVVSKTQFAMMATIWGVLFSPVPWSRIHLKDHELVQVFNGSLLGASLGAIWFYMGRTWMRHQQWRLGEAVYFPFIRHNLVTPVFKLRAIATTAVLKSSGASQAATSGLLALKPPTEAPLSVQQIQEQNDQVSAATRELERILKSKADESHRTFEEVLWDLERKEWPELEEALLAELQSPTKGVDASSAGAAATD